jgi:anthranilate phosphoribosyltransferase
MDNTIQYLSATLKLLLDNNNLDVKEYRKIIESLAILPKGKGNDFFGAISALMAKSIVSKNTLQGVVEGLSTTGLKIKIKDPLNVIDIVATGGELKYRTLYITPIISIIVSCHFPVILQGNKAVTGCNCGAFAEADILQEIGSLLSIEPRDAQLLLNKYNFVFLYAQKYHKILQKYANARSNLGFRDIFKVAACLADPAGVKRQFMGCYTPNLLQNIGEIMSELNLFHAIAVSSHDGIDEISVADATDFVEVKEGKVERYTLYPEDFGIKRCRTENIKGTDILHNEIQLIKQVLDGKRKDAVRDFVLVNSAAALYVTDIVKDFKSGMELAAFTIETGQAKQKLLQIQSYKEYLTKNVKLMTNNKCL